MMRRMTAVFLATLTGISVSYSQTASTQAGGTPAGALSSSLKVFVYPAKSQTAEQQQKDEGECFAWSKQQTGIDPLAPPPSTQQQPNAPKGGAVKGAAGGAVAGTAIGAIAGDAGTGAAIGATAGAMKGRRAQKKGEKAAQQQAATQQKAAEDERLNTFRKGFSACMEGRNYTVR